MKLCKDCKHYAGTPAAFPECVHPGNRVPDFVNGGETYNYATAKAVRTISDMCGPDGKWHEEKAND